MRLYSGRLTRARALLLCLLLLAPAAPAESSDAGPGHLAKRYRSYMAFGDSITYGTGTSDPATMAYPVQADVRGFGVNGACVVSADCGRGHYNARDWWPLYVDALEQEPDVVVFEIGLNDIAYASAVEIVAGLKGLRRLGRFRGIDVVFATVTPSPDGDFHRAGEKTRLQVNKWIRAQDDYVEYARPLQCEARTLCPQFISPTWKDVHLNDDGAAVVATALVDWIERDRAKR